MNNRITQKNLELAPKGFHRLDDCLYLRVSDSGRSFVFRYQKDGKRKDVGLGSAAKITIARAKEMALKLRTDLARGIEPQPKKKEAEEAAPEVKRERTFNEIYLEAIDVTEEARQWKSSTMRKMWVGSLERHACPAIGDKPLSQITRDDIADLLRPIWYEKTTMAKVVRARLEQVFSYALFRHEYEGQNPATWRGNLSMLFPSPEKIHKTKHQEAMTIEEAKRVSPILWSLPNSSDQAILFLLLTALRRTEALVMKWSEIDFDERIFYIPPERRKVARDYPHRVPLSEQAILLLKAAQARRSDGTEYVFESHFIQGEAISGERLPLMLSHRLGRRVTVHGCRATFRMWVEDTQGDVTAAEYQMMHENPSAVVRAYQRSDLLDRRRILMQKWADEILPLDVMKAATKGLDKLDKIPV